MQSTTKPLRFNALQLVETYENLFTSDVDRRLEIVDDVWEMLQNAYAPIGGIKGMGFTSKEDMIANVDMWKLFRRGNEILALMMYRNKSGRKRVAVATDGTPEGKAALKNMIIEEYRQKRAWGEVSGPSMGFIKRIFTEDEINEICLTVDQVRELMPNDNIVPTGNGNEYTRTLASGKLVVKLALGNPNQQIKKN